MLNNPFVSHAGIITDDLCYNFFTGIALFQYEQIDIQQMLEERQSKTKLLLQVHDELVFDLALDEADELIPLIEAKMKTAIPMEIPILVESGTGENWLEAH